MAARISPSGYDLESLAQRARRADALAVIPALLLLRLVLGSVSYAAGTPGGLFAPMLVLGSKLGLSVGLLGEAAVPSLALQLAGFAVVGMADFFTRVVWAPLTGIVLVIEMTGNVTIAGRVLRGDVPADHFRRSEDLSLAAPA